MKVIGLDMSLTGTGLAYPGGNAITISSKFRGMDRIIQIRDHVMQAVFGADLVVIEDYAFGSRSHAHEIGELGGVVKHGLIEHALPYALVNIGTAKRFATGKGNADKTAMAVAAAKLGHEFGDDNQCDAWWLQQMALYRFNGECFTPNTAYRDEAVGKVDWPTTLEVAQ